MRAFKWRIACYSAIKTEVVRNDLKFQNLRGPKLLSKSVYKYNLIYTVYK